jgi:sugar/nucleoside kinase (ribokinase family)
MKVLVIGQSVEDHINVHEKEFIKPGGIYYSAITLENFKDKNDEIYLLTAVAKNNYSLFSSLYDKLDKKFFQFVDNIPKVNLTLCEHSERKEKYENITQSLQPGINDYQVFNGILINMITGFDITLENLIEIRKKYKGIIYMDIHTLSRGLNDDLVREFRRIPAASQWISSVDIIQVNQREAYTLSDKKSEMEIAKEVLNLGVRFLIVTKGEIGVRLYSLKEGELISVFKSALRITNGNKVGCGDVFGGVFFYDYIKNGDEVSALEKANIAAGLSASFHDFNEFSNLKKNVVSGYY